ncbi:MAG: hypothetical protein PHU27_02155 [Salinivirgaceae bacterium]|nr:hypothetical protein [Salinivirgaceae bacterium]
MTAKNKTSFKRKYAKVMIRLRRTDNRTATFLFFLLISSVLWFLNALSKDYITEIETPIQIVGVPHDLRSHEAFPNSITTQISGRGFTLLRYKIATPGIPFKFDMSPYFAGYTSQQEVSFQAITQLARKQIEQYYGGIFTVLDVYPRNINATFSRIEFKKVAVAFHGNIQFESQFWQKGPLKIEPDSIEIGGPKSIIDTVKCVYTQSVNMLNVNSFTTIKTSVDHQNLFEIDNWKIKISVDVEKFTESTLKVPIRVVNMPALYNVMLFPDYVTVKFLVSLDEYERINVKDFLPIVDYERMSTKVGKEKIKVDVVEQPESIKKLTIHPREVNYVIGVKR